MPPPSPGDDPILLSGRPGTRARARTSAQSSPTRAGRINDDMDDEEDTIQLDDDNDNLATNIMDVSMGPEPSTDFSDATGPALPMFDLSAPQPFDFSAGWSDSDSEDGDGLAEGEGEYTGRFTMMTVPTKADPPTSGTRQRMEGWGRPIR